MGSDFRAELSKWRFFTDGGALRQCQSACALTMDATRGRLHRVGPQAQRHVRWRCCGTPRRDAARASKGRGCRARKVCRMSAAKSFLRRYRTHREVEVKRTDAPSRRSRLSSMNVECTSALVTMAAAPEPPAALLAEREDSAPPVPKSRTSSLLPIVVSGVGFFSDVRSSPLLAHADPAQAYDLFVINIVMAILDKEFATPDRPKGIDKEKAYISTAVLIGAVLGQLFFGLLADRIGRRLGFIITLSLVILGAILSAFAFPYAACSAPSCCSSTNSKPFSAFGSVPSSTPSLCSASSSDLASAVNTLSLPP